jgi:hypothetical protein
MDRHPGDVPPAAAAVSRRLLETGRGSRSESFGAREWLPLAGAAWAVLLLRRPLPRTHAVGLLLGFAGVLAISWPQLQGSRATMLGAIRVVLAVLCYGLAYFIPVVAIVLGVLLEEPWPPRP